MQTATGPATHTQVGGGDIIRGHRHHRRERGHRACIVGFTLSCGSGSKIVRLDLSLLARPTVFSRSRASKITAVALANKMARVIWTMMITGDGYREPMLCDLKLAPEIETKDHFWREADIRRNNDVG